MCGEVWRSADYVAGEVHSIVQCELRNRRQPLTSVVANRSVSANVRLVRMNPDDEVLKALVEPRRRAILKLVARTELAAGDIAAVFDVTRPAISQHLTVLRCAGLLHERRVGSRRLYRARPEGFDGLRTLLDELWGDGSGVPGRGHQPEQSRDTR